MGLTYRVAITLALMLAGPGAAHRASANYGVVVPPPATAPVPQLESSQPPNDAASVPQSDDDEDDEDEDEDEAPPPRRLPPLRPAARRPLAPYAFGPHRISGNMLGLRFGFAGGGTTLVKAQLSNGEERTITAGGGGDLAVVAAVTPFWTETFGVGAGLEFGWKGQEISASNAKISMSRFPLVATAHILAQVAGHSYVMILAGVQHDIGISFSTSGDAPAPNYTLASGVGFLAGLGYHHAFGQNFTLDGLLRFVKLDYEAHMGAATGEVDAKHVAFLLGANYQFDAAADRAP